MDSMTQRKKSLEQIHKGVEAVSSFGDFYNTAIDFIFVIENDPDLNKLITNKIDEYFLTKQKIEEARQNGEIDDARYDELYKLHVIPDFLPQLL